MQPTNCLDGSYYVGDLDGLCNDENNNTAAVSTLEPVEIRSISPDVNGYGGSVFVCDNTWPIIGNLTTLINVTKTTNVEIILQATGISKNNALLVAMITIDENFCGPGGIVNNSNYKTYDLGLYGPGLIVLRSAANNNWIPFTTRCITQLTQGIYNVSAHFSNAYNDGEEVWLERFSMMIKMYNNVDFYKVFQQ